MCKSPYIFETLASFVWTVDTEIQIQIPHCPLKTRPKLFFGIVVEKVLSSFLSPSVVFRIFLLDKHIF